MCWQHIKFGVVHRTSNIVKFLNPSLTLNSRQKGISIMYNMALSVEMRVRDTKLKISHGKFIKNVVVGRNPYPKLCLIEVKIMQMTEQLLYL
jgi:hypothetical protein